MEGAVWGTVGGEQGAVHGDEDVRCRRFLSIVVVKGTWSRAGIQDEGEPYGQQKRGTDHQRFCFLMEKPASHLPHLEVPSPLAPTEKSLGLVTHIASRVSPHHI
jgi:hypothetical protein